MKSERASSQVEELHPFEREILQCKALLSKSETLLGVFDALPSYNETCQGMKLSLAGKEISFEDLPRVKQEILVKINEALTSLEDMDTEIRNASGKSTGVMEGSKNMAVKEMREMLERLQSALQDMKLSELPTDYPIEAECKRKARAFSDNSDRGPFALQAALRMQQTERGANLHSSDMEMINFRAVQKIVSQQSGSLVLATYMVDDFYSALLELRGKAQTIRTQQFAELTPHIVKFVQRVIEADQRGVDAQRRDGEISAPVLELQNLVTTTIPRRAGKEFWTSRDYRNQVGPILGKAEKRQKSLNESSVLADHRKESAETRTSEDDVVETTTNEKAGLLSRMKSLLWWK